METWKLALRFLQLVNFVNMSFSFVTFYIKVLVITVFFLARFGLGFQILQYGYVVGEFPEPSKQFIKYFSFYIIL